jgi:two-component system CheB/CheR fusion protein
LGGFRVISRGDPLKRKKVFPTPAPYYIVGIGASAGGLVALGSAESVGTASELFSQLPGNTRLYRRLDARLRALPVGFPSAFVHSYNRPGDSHNGYEGGSLAIRPTFQGTVEKLVLQRYAPAAVLATEIGETLYVSWRTGKYLEPATGTPRLNVFTMARDGLSQALSETFHKAVREKSPATLKDVKVEGSSPALYVHLRVQPLDEPTALPGMVLTVFNDAAVPRRRKSQPASLNDAGEGVRVRAILRELRQSRHQAKSVREEMQTANHELQAKVNELSRASNDMRSQVAALQTSANAQDKKDGLP